MDNNQFSQKPIEAEGDFLESFDLERFWYVLKRSKFWMIAFIILGTSSAYIYVRYTKPVYSSQSIIKLDFESEANVLGLVDVGNSQERNEISGEIKLIKSELFLSRVAEAAKMDGIRRAAEDIVRRLPGVESASVVLTAHGPAPKAPEPPSLKVGRHPTPQAGPAKVSGVDRILAIGSGKGGVGKSTVSSNLAVALAKEGRRVGLLDADIYGPSQPRMMDVNKRTGSPDGKPLIPLQAHGVQMMSIGLMLEEGHAVVWSGPMVLGAEHNGEPGCGSSPAR